MSIALSSVRPAARSRHAGLTSGIRQMARVWSERRALAQLDAARLRDLGISPAEASVEVARPFWDLPNGR